MSRYHSYINSAKSILSVYNGEEPFASFLKKYFSQQKKFGSRDRKNISHLCYCYFRLGKSELDLPVEEKILVALFLCATETSEMLDALKPEWNRLLPGLFEAKCSILNLPVANLDIFPWKNELSDAIDYEIFNRSFLIQPDLYLRIRPGKHKIVKQKLETAGIEFSNPTDDCIALPNSVKADGAVIINSDAVIQDLSSQRTGDLLLKINGGIRNNKLKVWDCCTASGGKSIMAVDILGDIDLTVSDIRPGILHNLKKRFAEAGIQRYKSFVTDLSRSGSIPIPADFDLIIADVPCTGSGTWSRTPEQLYYFNVAEIKRYSELQKSIVANAIPHLKPGGYLLYITCSVFKQENEGTIKHLLSNFPLQLREMKGIKGYDQKADTMFAALLQKL